MKKAIGLALAVLATSVVAASAQGSTRITAASAASVNCKSTITLPLVTPVTGGAGFHPPAPGPRANHAPKPRAEPPRLNLQFVSGDTPAQQQPSPAHGPAHKEASGKK